MALEEDFSHAVRDWISADPDPETQAAATALLTAAQAGDHVAEEQLRECFTERISFGTSGLRAELGPGPARMNRVVVAQASAGFAAFLWQRAGEGATSTPPSAVVGFDGRINSERFAKDTAEVLAGAGVRVTLLPGPSPTPLTAFAVRHLGVSAGVMITASHNPPGDNGYKVYLGDADNGSQIAPPTDQQIAALIDAASAQPVAELPRSDDYQVAGHDIIDAYVSAVAAAFLHTAPREADNRDRIRANDVPLNIVYTAMHGVGGRITKRVFAAAGLSELNVVAAQQDPDGHFSTLRFPNPEEDESLELAYDLAREIGAEVVVAHDPDADRLALALPHPETPGGWRRLTGNELGLLLGWRAAEREISRARAAAEPPRGALANTIVSSPALGAIAAHYGLDHHETLSGFKWVSRVPGLLFGYEEALGYLTHPGVLGDKDGILASVDAIAMVREAKAQNRTVWQLLDEASQLFGHFASRQIVIRLSSHRKVRELSNRIRFAPPVLLGGSEIIEMKDLLTPGIAAVPANVLTYHLADGSRVMVRPSGTEPKLKVYIDSCANEGTVAERRAAAAQALAAIEADLRTFLAKAQE